ncbi:MAG: hypothetical protein K5857_09120 [Lachnospiraceae bacterium]|nr:hypothetical protein [Lachnospiraceae bacterium]
MSDLFRKKSLERISSPEELNDYIRVTTPGIWLILVAITLLLIGMLTFSCLYTAPVNTDDGGQTDIRPITLITN